MGKDEDKADYDPERHPGQPSQGLEQPVRNSWLLVTRKPKKIDRYREKIFKFYLSITFICYILIKLISLNIYIYIAIYLF